MTDQQQQWVRAWTDAFDQSLNRSLHAVVTTRRFSFPCGRRFDDWGLLSADTEDVHEVAKIYRGTVCQTCWSKVQAVTSGTAPMPPPMRPRRKK